MAQFRTRRAPLDGILLIDKPAGFTSHDVVARVRRALAPRRQEGGPRRHARPLRHRPADRPRRARRPSSRASSSTCPRSTTARCSSASPRTPAISPATSRRPARATSARRARGGPAAVPRAHQPAGADDVGGQGRRRAALQEGAPRRGRRDAGEGGRDQRASTCSTSTRRAADLRCRIACSKGTYVRQLAIDIGEAVGAGAYLRQLARAGDRPVPARGRAGAGRASKRPSRHASDDRAHPRPALAGQALQFMPARRGVGRAGGGRAQRRPPARRRRRTRCA